MTLPAPVGAREELLAHPGSFGCLNCGTCTAVCPLPREQVLMPRQVLRLLHLGRTEELVEKAGSVYSCLLCRLCEETCPAGIRVSECVRYLRSYLNRTVHHVEGG